MLQRIAPIRSGDGDVLLTIADKAEAFSDYFSSTNTLPSANADILSLQHAKIISPNVSFLSK